MKNENKRCRDCKSCDGKVGNIFVYIDDEMHGVGYFKTHYRCVSGYLNVLNEPYVYVDPNRQACKFFLAKPQIKPLCPSCGQEIEQS